MLSFTSARSDSVCYIPRRPLSCFFAEICDLADRFKREWRRKAKNKQTEVSDVKPEVVVKIRVSTEPILSTPQAPSFADDRETSRSKTKCLTPHITRSKSKEGLSERFIRVTPTSAYVDTDDSDADGDDESELPPLRVQPHKRQSIAHKHRSLAGIPVEPFRRESIMATSRSLPSPKRRRRRSYESHESETDHRASKKQKTRLFSETALSDRGPSGQMSGATPFLAKSESSSCVIC